MARPRPGPKFRRREPSPAAITAAVDRAILSSASTGSSAMKSRQEAFLLAISGGASLTKACKLVGVSLQCSRNWRKDPEFFDRFADAEEEYAQSILDEVRERAFDRENRSDQLLMFLTKSVFPEFRDNYKVQVENVQSGPDIHDKMKEIGDVIRTTFEAARARALAAAAANTLPAFTAPETPRTIVINGSVTDVSHMPAIETKPSVPPAPTPPTPPNDGIEPRFPGDGNGGIADTFYIKP